VGELIRVIGGLYRDPLSLGEVLQLCDLEDLAKREVQRLSGGERQRVRLALALAGDPEFVVLDEPTATLDVAARNAFWQRAQAAVSEGRTVLYATHRLEEADAVADRVVVIAAGRVMADGTPDEVKAQSAARHTVRFSAGHVEAGTLEHLPGVQEVESRQDRWTLYTTDADQTIRALLQQIPHASEMEVTRAGLEDVFLSLIQESGSS
jgi:ABC-2 type transport system ATP-binding protein